jgi:uncharacterized protein (TIGR02646 family)
MMKAAIRKKEIRTAVYHKYGGRCAYCGTLISYEKMQVDHIHPRSRQGEDSVENYNPACFSCNHYKASYTLEEFKEELKQCIPRFRKFQAMFRLAERFGLVMVSDDDILFYFEVHGE